MLRVCWLRNVVMEETSTGKSFDNSDSEYENVQAELRSEKMSYLRAKLLYTSLYNVIDGDCESVGEDEMIEEITDNVMQAEMTCCLQMLPNAVKKKKITISSATQAFLVEKVKKDLESRCQDFLKFYEDKTSDSYPNRTVFEAKALHIGEILEEERKKLQMLQHEIKDLQKHENGLLVLCTTELTKSINMLIQILKKFKIELQPKLDEAKFENLISQCELIGLKVVSMSWNLKRDLYHENSLAALRILHNELVQSKKNKLQETSAIEEKLCDFEILGEQFNSIVKEYSQILQKIEKREWTLRKLENEISEG